MIQDHGNQQFSNGKECTFEMDLVTILVAVVIYKTMTFYQNHVLL